jgi:hypothetical protein
MTRIGSPGERRKARTNTFPALPDETRAFDLSRAPRPVRRIAVRYRVSVAHASQIAELAGIGGAL